MSYANNKGADQPAHPRSLISAFVVRCLDSVMSLVSVTKISSLMLASIAEQASLSLTWSETPEDTFSRDEVLDYWYSASTCCNCSRLFLFSDSYRHFNSSYKLFLSMSNVPWAVKKQTLNEPRHEKTCLRGL